ncbi:related to lysophospholipase [Pseudozyma flocculosa]|uniref:Related to lysophospholipase n=1 Tax=Pseudozyma flocculosa TaxID=84751 RepID=A0A5C3EZN0_9BASI|nr:related to lysophospholipase [Pseudozyma flocculosa]
MLSLSRVASLIWDVWGEPFATAIGAYEPQDRSYGRWSIPFSPMEKRLYENPGIDVQFHKVMMPNGKDWVWYQVWQDPAAMQMTGRRADMIFVQCRRYLDSGFRLLVPDLPSHGYSSGIHVYQRHMSGYTAGLRAVLHDVARRDDAEVGPGFKLTKTERRKTFMLGLSFGGLVAFSYAVHYPASLREDESDPDEIPIDGIIGVGPVVNHNLRYVPISKGLRVGAWIAERIFRMGRFELMVPHKKSVDRDPKVYDALINQDKRSHQGAFRIGHLFCIDEAMVAINAAASTIKHPSYVQMGSQDRVVDIPATLKWFRNVGADDKRFEMYPVCQHVVYRKAKVEAEDLAGRITVIDDNVKWMCQRSPAYVGSRYRRMRSYSSNISSLSDGSKASLFDHDDSLSDAGSVCTSVLSTPVVPREDFDFGGFAGSQRPSFDAGAAAVAAGPSYSSALRAKPIDESVIRRKLSYGEIIPVGSPDEWDTDADGERILRRPYWDHAEEWRPFQLYPHW